MSIKSLFLALLFVLPSAAKERKTDALAAQGVALLASGKSQEAIALFDQALKIDKKNVLALANRCTARYQLHDFEGAIADFSAATALKPKVKASLAASASDAYYQRAKGRPDPEDRKARTEDLYAAIKLDPKNALAYAEIGRVAFHQGQEGDAEEYFGRAIKLKPDFAQAYADRALARRGLKKIDQALGDIEKAILIDPKRGDFFGIRAMIHRYKGNKEQAEKDDRRAVELGDNRNDK